MQGFISYIGSTEENNQLSICKELKASTIEWFSFSHWQKFIESFHVIISFISAVRWKIVGDDSVLVFYPVNYSKLSSLITVEFLLEVKKGLLTTAAVAT